MIIPKCKVSINVLDVGAFNYRILSSNSSIDDDDITDYETTSCTLDLAQDGTFVYLLFDLYSDPSESINLYDASEYSSILVRETIIY